MDGADRYERFMLVVDENIDDRFRTGELLRRLGYRVFAAGSAAQALEIMRATPPAGVLADAGDAGMTVLAEARKEPSTAAVPVVLLASSSNAMLEGRMMRGLVAGLLQKPLNAERLFHAVESLVNKGMPGTMRVALSLPARLAGEHGEAEGTVSVLSEHGMFFRTLDPQPVHARLEGCFQIEGRHVPFRGEVVYLCSLEEGPFHEPGMGIRFLQVDPADRMAIAAFIREGLREIKVGTQVERRTLMRTIDHFAERPAEGDRDCGAPDVLVPGKPARVVVARLVRDAKRAFPR